MKKHKYFVSYHYEYRGESKFLNKEITFSYPIDSLEDIEEIEEQISKYHYENTEIASHFDVNIKVLNYILLKIG